MAPIVFDNVSKRFVLHHNKARSFQDLVVRNLHLKQNGNGTHEDFWALRDVSFEVPEGQMIGLIGPNGAGKSTALKLLARVFQPTSGKIRTQGRLNALIELNAGFHPELTGRENIYLSAALLGLGRRDIQRQFDEIVAFSELEKFLDTQVKHYSSGMQVRLGFAVATCFESDILLVDEVLAVGDANFKRKCMERIADIRERGTTIVYVSHTMGEIERNCDRALLIMDGKIAADGNPREIIEEYDRERVKPVKPQELYLVEYVDYQVPTLMYMGSQYSMKVTLRNTSPEVWNGRNRAGLRTISLAYHWLDRFNNIYQFLGVGTVLPRDVAPGETITVESPILPPPEPGIFNLELDVSGMGKGWFSRHGCTGPRVTVEVVQTHVVEDSTPGGANSH